MSESGLSLFDREPADGDNAPKRRSRRPLLVALTILLVALVAIGGAALWYGRSATKALDNIRRDPEIMPTRSNRPSATPTAGKTNSPDDETGKAPINIVLMGSDSRGDERGRSDVLQLLHLPGNRETAYLLSVPRDSWVDIPGHGQGKVNWAYSFGGPALTIETLEDLLDIQIDHTVIIDFEGFKHVIDALGGVTVYNRHASASRGFSFPKGELTLSGDSALAFVRERYALPRGDFDRAERQRDVIKAIAKQLSSVGVLTNPAKFSDVVQTIASQFTVDSGLTNDVIISLAMGSTAAFGNIKSLELPNLGTGQVGSQSTVRVDWDGVKELQVALQDDDLESFYASHGG